jgi:lipase
VDSRVQPSSQPLLNHVQANGTSLAFFEWRADLQGDEPTLLMVHATGFHGRVWDPVIARFPNRHIIALEQRGHGRSQTPELTEITDWVVFGRDLAAFVAALDLNGLIGIGHSMGSYALIQAAAFETGRFERLVLIDPTIFDPVLYHGPALGHDEQHPAAKRLNRFASAQAMIERFADRPPYSWFAKEALRDYCEHALLPAPEGIDFVLACHPRTEASIYMTARRSPAIFASVLALQIPVLLVRARLPEIGSKPDFKSSPTWPGLVSTFQNAREIYLPHRTHLVPMEDPILIAGLIHDELNSSRA